MFSLVESDEMYTLVKYMYPQWIKFSTTTKAPKVVKEKEFMKFLTVDNQKKKKQASYMKEEHKEIEEQTMNLDEVLKMKRDPTKINDTYQPRDVEKYWYQYWDQQKFFHADPEKALKSNKTYVMLLPPPNITGYLHLGHALTSAIEDTLVRTHRMRGFETLYIPGTDHAGIATQTVVEKNLWKTQKLTKYDLGRDKFLDHIWDWKQKNGDWIISQLKRVGSSLDWERYAFTMDQPRQEAVTEAFVRLHEKGLIYRANRLVNWCCKMRTALSDIEVDYIDIEKPLELDVPGHNTKVQFGWLTLFAYKVLGHEDQEIVVATTRLETMLGDVAVAVNSKDPRYTHLHGKQLVHPFIANRNIRVIVDDELVDMAFGTGAVKVTPSHDPNDYECGLRNKLEQVNIFSEDGSVNENGGQYAGMMRFDVRKKMEADLKELGLIRGKEVNKMRLGVCSRTKDVIEPMLKPQWYINTQTVRQRMIDAVKTKDLLIVPADYEPMWFNWIDGLRDWCISRQIWWGHRCPAYIVSIDGVQVDSSLQSNWIIARSMEDAFSIADKRYNIQRERITLSQDSDVLDTWFSSGLFPFSTLGWPNEQTLDLKAFFPNTILETGWDILFFWVARMVMFSYWLMDTLPFKTVFLHPIIRDKDGKKMSKSLGNVIDPVEIIDGTTLENLKSKVREGNLPQLEIERTLKQKENEFPEGIPECGSDALRFGLLSYMQRTSNINLDVLRIIGYRQFCNKIWQTVKFGLTKLPKELPTYTPQVNFSPTFALSNQWILLKLNATVAGVNKAIDDYEFGIATQRFQNFWQYELCDTYLEAIKNVFYGTDEALKLETQLTLMACLDQGFRLLHPMMPFLSEELWQKLPQYPGKPDALCIAEYPQANPYAVNDQALNDFEVLQNIARSLRQIGSAANLPPSARPDCWALVNNDPHLEQLIQKEQEALLAISRTKSITIISNVTEEHKSCGQGTAGEKISLFMNLRQHLNVGQEMVRLEKKQAELDKFIQNLEKKISLYSDKVPQKVKLEDTSKMEKYQKERQLLQEQITNLKL